jgi:hypothetical protein
MVQLHLEEEQKLFPMDLQLFAKKQLDGFFNDESDEEEDDSDDEDLDDEESEDEDDVDDEDEEDSEDDEESEDEEDEEEEEEKPKSKKKQPEGKKKEKLIPQSKVQQIVKNRVKNLKQQNTDLTSQVQQGGQYKQAIEDLATMAGMPVETFVRQAQVVKQLRGQGFNNQQIQTYIQQNPMVIQPVATPNQPSAYDDRLANIELMVQEQALLNNPKSYPGYAEISGDVKEYAKLKNIGLAEAYWALVGDLRLNQIATDTEQRVLANMKRKKSRQLASGGDSSSAGKSKKLGLSADELEAASLLGMSPEEYKAYSNMDNLGDFEALQNSKKTKKKR